jgi:hypothetical protein
VARLVDGQLDRVAEAELPVARSRLTPCRVPAGEVREEHAQHRRLDGVETRVRADELEGLLVP